MVKEVNKEHKNVEMTRKKKRSGIVYLYVLDWLCYIVQVLIAR